MTEIDLLEIGGFSLGHAQNEVAATGCSVLLFDKASPAGVCIRGGGPASRETPLLDPVADAKGIHALLLSGGSAFGLDAAGGVMQYLEQRNIGFDVGVTKVPLVCQSCLFDLGIGDSKVRPDATMAYKACENATKESSENGNIGAGMGCTVGKYRGMEYAMKGGLGTYAIQIGEVKVGAIVAVNALGDIFDRELNHGEQIAGMLDESKTSLRSTELEFYKDMQKNYNVFTGNTTIGAIITNATFDKSSLTKISSMAHNGYARAISPVHTTADGDSIYAISTQEVDADINAIGTLAAKVMERAIIRAIKSAKSSHGHPSFSEIFR